MDPNNPNGGLTGPFIVKGVEMPPEMAAKFENLKPVGNTEKTTAGSGFSRGIGDYQPMVREWVSLAQQYFTDKIDLDTYIAKYDEVLREPDLWAGLLEQSEAHRGRSEDPGEEAAGAVTLNRSGSPLSDARATWFRPSLSERADPDSCSGTGRGSGSALP